MSKLQPVRKFRDDPITSVYRHWRCAANGCDGEMKSTGTGITTMETSWLHKCNKCSREEWADFTYPRVAHLPIEAIDTTE